jgi:hypothetical protein
MAGPPSPCLIIHCHPSSLVSVSASMLPAVAISESAFGLILLPATLTVLALATASLPCSPFCYGMSLSVLAYWPSIGGSALELSNKRDYWLVKQ